MSARRILGLKQVPRVWLFAKDMHRYREWFAHIDDPEDENASEETSADDAE